MTARVAPWRRWLGVAVVSGLVVVGQPVAASGAPEDESPAPVAARSAREFVDSICVNTHLGRPGGIYGRYDDLVVPAFAELGIRHLRDGVQVDGDSQDFFDRAITDLGSRGVRSTLFWGGDYGQEGLGVDRWASRTRTVRSAVEAVEGPNEPDLGSMGFQYRGDGIDRGNGWAAGVRAWMRDMHETVKADPELRHLPVVGPATGWGKSAEQVGDLSQHLDVGNFHAYTAEGHGPESAMEDWHLRYARVMAPSAPLVATEGGYSTTGVGSHTGVSSYAHARYVPRMFLEHFRLGVDRTCSYELLDEHPDSGDVEGGFGLVQQDGSLKPAGVAVRNLIRLVDTAEPVQPGALAYALDGAGPDVRALLLGRGGNRFSLVIWQAARNQDESNLGPAPAPDQPVTLRLGQAASVATYRPLESGEPLGRGCQIFCVSSGAPDWKDRHCCDCEGPCGACRAA